MHRKQAVEKSASLFRCVVAPRRPCTCPARLRLQHRGVIARGPSCGRLTTVTATTRRAVLPCSRQMLELCLTLQCGVGCAALPPATRVSTLSSGLTSLIGGSSCCCPAKTPAPSLQRGRKFDVT
jgi:hypothetical protein